MSNPKDNPTQGGSFLPQEYVKGKGQLRANILVLMLFTLVLAGVIGAFVVNHQRWNRVHEQQKLVAAEYEEEAAKISQLQSLEKQRVDLIERAEVVTALKDRVPRSVLLGEVVRAVPVGLTLTTLNLEGERVKVALPAPDLKAAKKARTLKGKSVGKGKGQEKTKEAARVLPPKFKFTLSADGIAQDNDLIADFLASMKASPLFGDVELQYIKETTIDKLQYRKFKITMKLLENSDARLVDGTEEYEIGTVDFGIAGSGTDTE